jgi:pSer/pThr/pTyr-binding forkhead associated (FHA) protein
MARQAETDKLPDSALALYINTAKTPVVVSLTQPIILGRASDVATQMYLDLSSYDGADLGVSRQHLIFKRAETVTVEDMGSRNGTWLNGTRLQPYQPAVIQSGDELRLGKLEMEIYLPN